MQKLANQRMVKWTVLIVLLLLAFGKKIMEAMGISCGCVEIPKECDAGTVKLPENGIQMSAEEKIIDVEAYERAEDSDVTSFSDEKLLRSFSENGQSFHIKKLTYDPYS